MEQLLFRISHYEAPYKPLPSNKSLRKTIQNKTTTRTKSAKNKSVVVVVKKFEIQMQKSSPHSYMYIEELKSAFYECEEEGNIWRCTVMCR